MGSTGNVKGGGSEAPANNSAPDLFDGKLGDRDTSMSPIDRLTGVNKDNLVNPNVNMSEAYRTNCALCTTAAAMQMMGYDVEAMPRDTTWRGFNSVFDVDYSNPDNFILSGGSRNSSAFPSRTGLEHQGYKVPRMPKGANAAAKAIDDKVKSWGDGSFGYLSVKWKNSNSAHAILVFNDRGSVFGFDAQHNKVIPDLKSYLRRTVANSTEIARLDNAPVKKNIPDLDKMVKKSSRKNRGR